MSSLTTVLHYSSYYSKWFRHIPTIPSTSCTVQQVVLYNYAKFIYIGFPVKSVSYTHLTLPTIYSV